MHCYVWNCFPKTHIVTLTFNEIVFADKVFKGVKLNGVLKVGP